MLAVDGEERRTVNLAGYQQRPAAQNLTGGYSSGDRADAQVHAPLPANRTLSDSSIVQRT
jgi:hypothetical protein